MAAEFGLSRIAQIHVSVDDIDRAVAFYRDVLKMKFLFQVPGQPMAFFDCGGVRLYLGKPESPQFRSPALIYYGVDSIDEACRALAERGVELTAEPHVVHRTEEMELWMASLADPDGNPIALMSEVAAA